MKHKSKHKMKDRRTECMSREKKEQSTAQADGTLKCNPALKNTLKLV